jgi:hypothetical protein
MIRPYCDKQALPASLFRANVTIRESSEPLHLGGRFTLARFTTTRRLQAPYGCGKRKKYRDEIVSWQWYT